MFRCLTYLVAVFFFNNYLDARNKGIEIKIDLKSRHLITKKQISTIT